MVALVFLLEPMPRVFMIIGTLGHSIECVGVFSVQVVQKVLV